MHLRPDRRTVSSSFLLLSLLTASCASSSGPGPETIEQPTVLTQGAAEVVLLDARPSAADAVIAADPEAVWPALFAAYDALGIEIGHVDSDARVLGNRSIVVRRTLDGTALSAFFDCGHLTTGAPAANRYRVQVDMVTRLLPVDGGTRVTTTVAATGRDTAGTSGDRVRCNSTGRLEERLRDRIAGALAGDR